MKLIGLDVGTKRIGVAKADTATRIAVPDGFITVNGQEFSEIARLARLYNTTVFIIGLPRNNSGEETQQSAYVRNFARELAMTIPGVKIYFQDESLTSVEAENRLKSRKKTYQKGEIDAEAAAIILQDCIEHLTSGGTIKDLSTPEMAAPKISPESASGASQATLPPKVAKDAPQTGKPAKIASPGRKIGKTVGIIAGVIVLVAGLVAGGVAIWYNNALSPVSDVTCPESTSGDSSATEAATEATTDSVAEACSFIRFSVTENETLGQIGGNLEAAGLIRSSLAFQLYVRFNGLAANLQIGDYDFRPVMSVADIAYSLANGLVVDNVFNFTILPGETLADIRERLIDLGYSATEIDAAFSKHYDHPVLAGLYDVNGNLINSAQPLAVQLEGYLYGETYQFFNDESVENIIKRALDELYEVVKGNDLEAKFNEHGLSLREGIILASIVQKEAKGDNMPGVAQVFLNRLRTGMSLGSDVTATYAADLTDPERTYLIDNLAVLENDSLYNTRIFTGLTPGPISMPGITALLAVANPDESHSSDYYFLTGDDGVMYYSSNAAGHEQNIRDHCQTYCNVAL